MDTRSGGRLAGGRAAIGAAGLTVSCVVALVVIAAAAPAGFQSGWGFATASPELYRDTLGWFPGARFENAASFAWAFRSVLLLAWASWALMIAAALGGTALPTVRKSAFIPYAAAVVMALAVLAPPIFSTDAFAYTGWSRLMWAHGLNPYLHGGPSLAAAGDPAAHFLGWPATLPYGPAWALAARAAGTIGNGIGGLFGELLVHKLLAAGGLLATAFGAARIAEAHRAGTGTLTWLAVAFNPLLLCEGPIAGHNDFVALALLTWAAAMMTAGRTATGDLLLGVAIAVKFTAIGALPLVLIQRWRQRGVRPAAIALVLCVTPLLILSAAFGGIGTVFASIAGRLNTGGTPALPALRAIILLAAVLWGLRLTWREPRGSAAAWLEGWIPVSLAFVMTTTNLLFPWYFAWPLVPALTQWNERHRIAVIGVSTVAILSMWFYAAALP